MSRARLVITAVVVEGRSQAQAASYARSRAPAIAIDDYTDLAPFDVIVLAPERTLAEKLAFLHHRATIGDHEVLTCGARHLYDRAHRPR